AQRRAHHRAEAVAVLPREIEFCIVERQAGGGHGELGKPVEPPRPPLLDMVGGMEVVHLRGNAGAERSGVEPGDAPHRRGSPPESLPERLHARTDGGDGADAGDEDAAWHHERFTFSPAWRCGFCVTMSPG